MMPEPEDIYAYDIIGDGWLWRSSGRVDIRIFPLGPSTVNFNMLWRNRDRVVVQTLDRHFEVTCVDNGFRLVPTSTHPTDTPPSVVASTDEVVERVLEGFAKIAIAEHVTRSRLELWRLAAREKKPEAEVAALWERFLEAEAAITWSYPSIDWVFLDTQDEVNKLKAGP